jgi:hypothetical protein
MVKSPCVKICVMNWEKQMCEGCYRTQEEIGGWRKRSEEEQREILERIEERKRVAGKQGVVSFPLPEK